jgi:hypothetical protein
LLRLLVDPSLISPHANHLRLLFHPLGARRWIVNWDEVARHTLNRAQREFGEAPGDETAAALLRELHEYAGRIPEADLHVVHGSDLLLPIHIRKHPIELRLFSTVMTLGTPRDVTLQELRIETFFPADESSAAAWKTLAFAQEDAAGSPLHPA